jgi:ProP effector
MINVAQIPQLDNSPTLPSTRQRREQAIAATITLLAETFPKCFAIYEGRRRPLKIGIHLDIQAALNGAITPAELNRVLGLYCSNPAYLSYLRKGAVRLDLNGEPAGIVADDEAAHAQEMLARYRRKKENRAAATKAQAQPVKRSSLADLKAAAVARKSGAIVGDPR